MRSVSIFTEHPLMNCRCDDGDALTTNDECFSGICHGCPLTTDDCQTAAGTWNPSTNQCSAPAAKADGAQCDDSDATTTNNVCVSGLCQGCLTC